LKISYLDNKFIYCYGNRNGGNCQLYSAKLYIIYVYILQILKTDISKTRLYRFEQQSEQNAFIQYILTKQNCPKADTSEILNNDHVFVAK